MDRLPSSFLLGVELFNRGEYFDCHEALEPLWLRAEGTDREFLHALIQAAVALHHHRLGNLKGTSSVFNRAKRRLEGLPPRMMGVNTVDLIRELDAYFTAASDGASPSPLVIRIER